MQNPRGPPKPFKTGNASFRPKLDPVGKNKCRFLEHHYELVEQIGEGTYGQVFVARDKNTKEEVALKRIRMDSEKDGFPITAVREIKILKCADHENVIRLREIVRSLPDERAPPGSRCAVYMVFDLMEHDLTGYCAQMHSKLPLGEVKFFMAQLLRGLSACHENGILHRDLKLSNLLISRNGRLKIADFGLARPYQEFPDSKMTNRVITLWYRPPELMLGADRYGTGVDMWSVGCIFAELLVGKPLFPGESEIDQLDKIYTMIGAPNERTMPGCEKLAAFQRVPTEKYVTPKLPEWCQQNGITTQAKNLLLQLLNLDPSKRPTASRALEHPFFSTPPLPCQPKRLYTMAPSHEYTVKRKRTEGSNQTASKGNHVRKEYVGDTRGPATKKRCFGHHDNGGRGYRRNL